MPERHEDAPDFGPSGYLPERASKRARKIVLRAPLGLQWVVASLLAGVVVVVAGVLLLTRGDPAPAPPFVAVGSATDLLGEVRYDGELGALLVGVGGRIRAFDAPPGIAYCAASRRLEDGARVWALTGRALGGGRSLPEHPTIVSGGTVYVDPTVTAPTPAPTTETVAPACD